MRNGLVLFFAGLIILFNAYIWKSSPPSGMLITPIVLAISSGLILFFSEKLKILFKSLLLVVCAVFLDQSSSYAGGKYDSEGDAVINLFFFFGVLISFILLLIGLSVTQKEETWKEKLLAILLYPAAMLLYFQIRMT